MAAAEEQLLRSLAAGPWRAQAIMARSMASMFEASAKIAEETAERLEKGELTADLISIVGGQNGEPVVEETPLGKAEADLLQQIALREETDRARDLEVFAVAAGVGRDVIGAAANVLFARGFIEQGDDPEAPDWATMTPKGEKWVADHGSE